MKSAMARNLHVPLSEDAHARLKRQAARAGRPATVLAREAIDAWLNAQERLEIREEISAYARAAAGSREDLDPALERAAVEHLTTLQRRRRRP